MTPGGRLVLVATPIGNLGDLSARAADTLRGAELICCEDTRRTAKLLAHAGVSGVRLAVANEHTEAAVATDVLSVLGGGGTVAVVSDAGTPGISDPGGGLVRAALDAGFSVEAVPGPAALVAALVVSGLDTSRFVFEGFLPRTGRDRAARLAEVAGERRTIVLYEAPHRVRRTVADLAAACGRDRPVSISRELTKLYEETWRGSLGKAVDHLELTEPRGEYAIVVGGAPPAPAPTDAELREALQESLRNGADRRTAVATVMSRHGASKRRVYEIALTIPRHD